MVVWDVITEKRKPKEFYELGAKGRKGLEIPLFKKRVEVHRG
jgi:hypothetical protein